MGLEFARELVAGRAPRGVGGHPQAKLRRCGQQAGTVRRAAAACRVAFRRCKAPACCTLPPPLQVDGSAAFCSRARMSRAALQAQAQGAHLAGRKAGEDAGVAGRSHVVQRGHVARAQHILYVRGAE